MRPSIQLTSTRAMLPGADQARPGSGLVRRVGVAGSGSSNALLMVCEVRVGPMAGGSGPKKQYYVVFHGETSGSSSTWIEPTHLMFAMPIHPAPASVPGSRGRAATRHRSSRDQQHIVGERRLGCGDRAATWPVTCRLRHQDLPAGVHGRVRLDAGQSQQGGESYAESIRQGRWRQGATAVPETALTLLAGEEAAAVTGTLDRPGQCHRRGVQSSRPR